MQITLSTPEQSLGTKTVTVVAGPPAAARAAEFLRGAFTVNHAQETNPDLMRWIELVNSGGDVGRAVTALTAADLAQYERVAAIVGGHPDWTDTARLMVAVAQSRTNLRAAMAERERHGGHPAIDVAGVADPDPQLLRAVPNGRFAKALQARVQSLLDDREGVLRQIAIRPASRPASQPVVP